jgi:hypothetical protein
MSFTGIHGRQDGHPMMRSPKHLRERARDCLNISKSVSTSAERSLLEDIAAEMNATAARIDADKDDRLSA